MVILAYHFPEISDAMNTVRVLQEFSDYIPENPLHVADILWKITERNALSVASNTSPWDTTFEPAETQCLLCGGQLSPAVRVPGSNCRAYLLTRLQLIPVRSLIRRCTSRDCGARYNYSTWKEGKYACASNTMTIITMATKNKRKTLEWSNNYS